MVKKGYKQTEIGIIPEDWNIDELGNISFITKLAGFEYSKYFNSYKDKGEIIVIRGTNITNNRLDLSDIKTIPRKTSNYLIRSKLNKGDLVFAYVGTIGPVFLIEENDKYHLGPNTSKITLNKNVSNNFIFSYFYSWLIKKEIIERTSVGAQPSLSMAKIRSFKIILPTFKEQKIIATVLIDIDNLIVNIESLITKKEAVKQGAMQQLLTGKKRLNGFTGEWEVDSLDKLSSYINDGTHHTPNYTEKGIPFYSVETLTNNDYENVKYISEEEHLKLIKRCKPERGDILLTRIGTLGKTKLIDWDIDASIYVSLALIKVRKEKIDSRYLYSYTKSDIFIQDIIKRSLTKATPQKINMGEIGQVPISYPKEVKEQQAIAQIFIDMDAEIEDLQQRKGKTEDLKKGMMQELLTGKTRLI